MKTRLQLIREARSAKLREVIRFTDCEYCGNEISVERRDKNHRIRFCSRHCADNYHGSNHKRMLDREPQAC